MLHENPVMTRQDIGNAISKLPINDPANPLSTPLGTVGLADQIELLKITPATLGREEMAWLWTALKADYRPTFPFQVSVVLIEPQNPEIVPLPVLLRNIVVEPDLTPFPSITAVIPPFSQPAARLGQSVTVQGHHLLNATNVVLTNSLRGIQQAIVPTSAGECGTAIHAAPAERPGRTGGRHLRSLGPGDDRRQVRRPPTACRLRSRPASTRGRLACCPRATRR